jgi:hypothetical protein
LSSRREHARRPGGRAVAGSTPVSPVEGNARSFAALPLVEPPGPARRSVPFLVQILPRARASDGRGISPSMTISNLRRGLRSAGRGLSGKRSRLVVVFSAIGQVHEPLRPAARGPRPRSGTPKRLRRGPSTLPQYELRHRVALARRSSRELHACVDNLLGVDPYHSGSCSWDRWTGRRGRRVTGGDDADEPV